jgi:hypothetical protein
MFPSADAPGRGRPAIQPAKITYAGSLIIFSKLEGTTVSAFNPAGLGVCSGVFGLPMPSGGTAMIGGGKTLYPTLGVGAFFVMFWVGFVLGYELGLSCGLFLLNALAFACAGAWCVVRLELADSHPSALRRGTGIRDGGAGRGKSSPAVPLPNLFVPR